MAVITERPSTSQAGGRRREWKRMTVELVKLYQELRMKKLNAVQWRARTAEVVERLRRLDERSVPVKLYQAHLLITEERFEEAGRILKQVVVAPRVDGAEVYCYYLYLSSLYQRDEGYTARAAMDVEEAHRAKPGKLADRMADAFPFSAASEKCLAQMVFSGGSVCAWNHQSRAVSGSGAASEFQPHTDHEAGAFERQVVHYGARCGILSADMAGHLAYLAEKEKIFRCCPV